MGGGLNSHNPDQDDRETKRCNHHCIKPLDYRSRISREARKKAHPDTENKKKLSYRWPEKAAKGEAEASKWSLLLKNTPRRTGGKQIIHT